MSGVEIDLLGRFAVRRGGRAVETAEFGGRRVRQLVRILAAERGRVVSRDVLIEALWGEELPASPGTNLNVVVNRARRALGEPEMIQTAGGGYVLPHGTELVVDVERFEEFVGHARAARSRGDHVTAASTAQAALELWDEPLPEDAYTEWARPHRDRLERLHQDALEIGTDGLLATGNAREAVALAAQAVARQPLREAAYLLLVRAYAAEGDQAAAVATYRDLRRMLADELGIDPSSAAMATYDQLLHGTLPARRVATRSRSRSHLPPLVGRERELIELLAVGTHQRIAVVSGRSGWGKSRLLDALCGQAARPALLARAVLPEREEPWSLARALMQTPPATEVDPHQLLGATTLAALADVVPDLDATEPAADPQSRRALVQQGLLRVVEATAPSLVVVDDLQWADSSSLDLLALLVGRSSDVAMVFAYRPEEVAEDTPVARFLAEVREIGPVQVPLGPLDTAAMEELVTSPAMAVALAEHTDGTPFAVLQVLRSLEAEGLLRRNAAGGWDVVEKPPPDRVRDLARAGQRDAVWRQFQRLPRDARRLLAALSLLGRPVPVRLLSAAGGVSVDGAIGMLRDLARSHLVGHDAEGFRVDHDLVGETIRDRLDAAERAGLHHRLAISLASDDGPVEELARHLAGAGDVAAAASSYATAAKARLDRFANNEAEQLASEGLALDPPSRVRAHLLEVRAETLARKGAFDRAREDLRDALAATSTRPARSRLLTRLAQLSFGAEDLLHARELADLALAEAADDPGARARAMYVRALADMNMDRRELAEDGFDEALGLFTSVGDAAGMADIVEARAMTTFGNGDITGAIEQFGRAARLFTDSGNLLRVVWPRSNQGYGLHFAGRPLEGLEETSSALELSRRLGYAEGEAMTLYQHAEVLVGCGRADEALLNAEAGLALGRRLGHRASMATTSLALGVAQVALGRPADAIAAFQESLRISGEHLVLFRCWGKARLALVLLDQDRLDDAATHVDEALARGPDLAQYEVRLARCELAVRRADHDAGALVDEALELAVAGGHAVTEARLEQLRERIT
jgi:DNA-binding SARP family transcriptional activator